MNGDAGRKSRGDGFWDSTSGNKTGYRDIDQNRVDLSTVSVNF